MTHIRLTLVDELATLILAHPPQNRIGSQMVDELAAALDEIERSEARAVLVCAEGPDFSFGGDIVRWPQMTNRELRTSFETYMVTFNHFERLPIPTIVAVQGLCFGGGLELAVRADVIFAGETARFGHPEQSIGIVTLLGGVYRVAERAGRSRAIEWAFTSEQVPATVMRDRGVVNRVVADADLMAQAKAFARKVANGPTRAHAAHKALMRIWATGGIAAADEAIMDIAMPLFETDDVKMALQTSVDAFLEAKPRPAFSFKGR
ncbi:enoyl-CoA hydratase/isomerase family protein [Bradyrhizobium sp. 48]|uniref:enoyl-CoA hydratase/isomerase family protein n=1 Tax=Bradyrhizobium sp. 48 TaxID=2782676 RepID=UPI001FFBD010|nr:enoyl-CoA hydratase/isomerase family protein [Bradyrhizobium sp. 48]MCK1446704.1 enoyl-CoA hydratase/isomerase family protein [Bradyrhizobium sp. 48]